MSTILVIDSASSTSPTRVLLVSAAGPQGPAGTSGATINVANYGAVGNGTTSDSVAIQLAIDAAAAAGGGLVSFAGKTYICSVSIKTGVTLVGAGRGVTILKSPSGSNLPVVTTSDFAARLGTNDSSGTSPHNWAIQDLTLDGNKSSQTATGSAIDLASGMQVYGYNFQISRVMIQNSKGHGLRSHWGQYGEFPMESSIRDLQIDTCGRHGFWADGPHDTEYDTITVVDASQEADNTYCGIYVDNNGVSLYSKLHAWHRSVATNRMRANVSSAGFGCFTNSHFEGGRMLFESRGEQDKITNSSFYGCYGSAGGTMLDSLAGNIIITNCSFHNNPEVDVFAIRLGRSGAKVSGVIVDKSNLFFAFQTRGVFDVAGDNGLSHLAGVGYANAVTGATNALTTTDYYSGGPTDDLRTVQSVAGKRGVVTIAANDLTATGRTSSNFLRGDNTWQTALTTGANTFTGLQTLATGTTALAPLKFVSGTNLTTAVAGSVEWNGTNLFITQTTGPTRKTLAFTDSNITGTAAGLSSTLAVGSGGTGAVTLTGFLKGNGTGAFTAVTGIAVTDLTATGTKDATTYLRGDNTWATVAGGGGSGTVTSIDVLGGTTGLTTSGGPVTTSGSITLAGTLAVASGGTGATSAGAALTNLGAAPLASPTFTGTATTPAAVIGTGDGTGTIGSGTIRGASAVGTNISGGTLSLRAGDATGTGSSSVTVWTAPVGSSGATTNTTRQVALFSQAGNLVLGANDSTSTPNSTVIIASRGAGTNISGANLTLQGGVSTGTGTGGSIIFQTSPAGSTGSTANTQTTALTLASNAAATFTGTVTLPTLAVSNTMSLTQTTTNSNFTMQCPAAFVNNFSLKKDTGASVTIGFAANPGANLYINTFDDTGTYIETPFLLTRLTGNTGFKTLTTYSNVPSTSTSTGAIVIQNSGGLGVAGNINLGGTITGNGSGLTTLNASNLSSGTVGTARLGSGTASSTTYLRGDGTWATPAGGALNNATTTDPTVSDDSTGGYSVGSEWFNTSSGISFRARSVSAGAADWVASGALDHPGYTSTFWYGAPPASVLTTGSFPVGTMCFSPLLVLFRTTITSVSFYNVTNATAGGATAALAKLGIYSNSGGRPNALLQECTTDVDLTGSTVRTAAFSGITLNPGVYWVGTITQGTNLPVIVTWPSGAGGGGFTHYSGGVAGGAFMAGGQSINKMTRNTAVTYVAGSAFLPSTVGAVTLVASSTPGSPVIMFQA